MKPYLVTRILVALGIGAAGAIVCGIGMLLTWFIRLFMDGRRLRGRMEQIEWTQEERLRAQASMDTPPINEGRGR